MTVVAGKRPGPLSLGWGAWALPRFVTYKGKHIWEPEIFLLFFSFVFYTQIGQSLNSEEAHGPGARGGSGAE